MVLAVLDQNNLENSDLTLYNSKDIQHIFKCGRKQLYEILNTRGFPTIRIGAKFYVEKKALEKWIAQNQGKRVITEKY